MEIQTVQNAFSPHWSLVVKHREVHDLQPSPHLSHGTRTRRKKPWMVIVWFILPFKSVKNTCMSESYTLRKNGTNVVTSGITFSKGILLFLLGTNMYF